MRERHSRKHSEDSRSITPLILHQIWIDLLRVRAFFLFAEDKLNINRIIFLWIIEIRII